MWLHGFVRKKKMNKILHAVAFVNAVTATAAVATYNMALIIIVIITNRSDLMGACMQ